MGSRKERGNALKFVAHFEAMRSVAEACGYSLALHGSMQRDLDLIAVPWEPYCLTDEQLVESFCDKVSDLMRPTGNAGAWTEMPHGRRAVVLLITGSGYIDLSVMPRLDSPSMAVQAGYGGA
jgi:hypothetical protein